MLINTINTPLLTRLTHHQLIGRWYTYPALWKIWVRQLGWLFPTEWKNKTCSKSPISIYNAISRMPILSQRYPQYLFRRLNHGFFPWENGSETVKFSHAAIGFHRGATIFRIHGVQHRFDQGIAFHQTVLDLGCRMGPPLESVLRCLISVSKNDGLW